MEGEVTSKAEGDIGAGKCSGFQDTSDDSQEMAADDDSEEQPFNCTDNNETSSDVLKKSCKIQETTDYSKNNGDVRHVRESERTQETRQRVKTKSGNRTIKMKEDDDIHNLPSKLVESECTPSIIQANNDESQEAPRHKNEINRSKMSGKIKNDDPVKYTDTEISHMMTLFPVNKDMMADKKYPFVCYICDFTCKGFKQLKKHKLVHRGQKAFPCTLCNSTSKTSSDFKRHKMMHFNVKPYGCDQCPYSTAVSTNLKNHKKIHTGEKPFACTFCNYSCSEGGNLKKHLRIHSVEKPFVCGLCDFSCRTAKELGRHKQKHPKTEQHPCGFASVKLDTLRNKLIDAVEKSFRHESSDKDIKMEEVNKQSFECTPKVDDASDDGRETRVRDEEYGEAEIRKFVGDSRGQLFEDSLKRRLKESCDTEDEDSDGGKDAMEDIDENQITAEGGEDRSGYTANGDEWPSLRDKCDESQDIAENIRKFIIKMKEGGDDAPNLTETELHHMVAFYPMNEDMMAQMQFPFVCYICDFTCKGKEEFKEHKLTHRGQRVFPCTLCDSVSKTSGDFKRHKMLHFNLKPFVCDRCPYATAFSPNLKKHKMIHSGVKPHTCNSCGYSCTELGNLRKHQRIHSDELSSGLPFTCNMCEFSCRTAKEFIRHSLKHSETMRYSCDQCSCTYATLDTLKAHKLIHTRGARNDRDEIRYKLDDDSIEEPFEDKGNNQMTPGILAESSESRDAAEQAEDAKFERQLIKLEDYSDDQLSTFTENEQNSLGAQDQMDDGCGKAEQIEDSEFEKQLIKMEDDSDDQPFMFNENCNVSSNIQSKSEETALVNDDLIRKMIKMEDNGEEPINYTETEVHHVMAFFPMNKDLMADMQYPFVCYICDFTCKDIEEFKKHKLVHRGQKLFPCTLCNSTCKKASDFKRHKMLHFNVKPYVCDQCPYSTAVSTNLRKHKMIHTGVKPYACSTCNYACSELGSLKKHQLIHSGEKPFLCSLCDFSCRSSSDLTRHKTTHFEIKQYSCDMCSYTCARLDTLRIHSLVHTDEKPFSCESCSFVCKSLGILINHKRRHSGERPYGCEICPFTCVQLASFRRHMQGHSEVRAFACDVCNFSCKRRDNLKKHKMLHAASSESVTTQNTVHRKTQKLKEIKNPSVLPEVPLEK